MQGLTAAQVSASRTRYGDNSLPERAKKSFFSSLLENLRDPIIRVLLFALAANAALAFRAFRWYESLGIVLSIVFSTLVSALSERGSESAFARIQAEAQRTVVRVLRGGERTECPCAEVVVGDLVLLQAGERVPADGVLIEGSLRVDQSALNGEPREVLKTPGAAKPSPAFSDPAALFRGSVICAGEGVLRVTAVGAKTVYGGLAHELQADTRESPLKLRLGALARTLSRIGYVGAAVVGLADLFCSVVLANGFRTVAILAMLSSPAVLLSKLLHAVTLAVTVVVVAVPEGLPMMITVVLSSNMRRMLKGNVLVRRLVGIETSGSLKILFCDKTGTLTYGRMAVETVATGAGTRFSPDALRRTPLYDAYARGCALNTQSVRVRGKSTGGNATERALLDSLSALPDLSRWRRVSFEPFDSAKKLSRAVVTDARTGKTLSLCKGAPELLLPRCTQMLDERGTPVPLDRRAVLRTLEALTGDGMRVLALAEGTDARRMTLAAFAGIRDRVRPEARPAVEALRGAGVHVVMMTGDNAGTASAVARAAGILDDPRAGDGASAEDGARAIHDAPANNGAPADNGAPAGDGVRAIHGASDLALDSAALAALPDEEVRRILPRLAVLSRARPDDKTRLVRLAQEAGLVVGMTGDGVNDAPALKAADVGFAMGSGTEVAREAGDIVILDDNIASIVRAVLYGRTIFKSIRKFIVFQLTINLCAVGISVLGPVIGVGTPVTVIQMLWVNLIMDTLAGLAFAGEPPRAFYLRERPIRRDEPIFTRAMLFTVLSGAAFTLAVCLWYLLSPVTRGFFGFETRPIVFMTGFFVLFIFCAVAGSFNVRTTRINLLADLGRNPPFLAIMTLVAAAQLMMVYLGGPVFRTAPLSPRELGFCLALSLLVIPAETVRKLLLRLGKTTSLG
ncbi:MAG: cation-transporting P-type ATPase [Eubacteriales bacterium]|nr:cation-transporting P-type ATPase [Eubacteriales bacterium]